MSPASPATATPPAVLAEVVAHFGERVVDVQHVGVEPEPRVPAAGWYTLGACAMVLGLGLVMTSLPDAPRAELADTAALDAPAPRRRWPRRPADPCSASSRWSSRRSQHVPKDRYVIGEGRDVHLPSCSLRARCRPACRWSARSSGRSCARRAADRPARARGAERAAHARRPVPHRRPPAPAASAGRRTTCPTGQAIEHPAEAGRLAEAADRRRARGRGHRSGAGHPEGHASRDPGRPQLRAGRRRAQRRRVRRIDRAATADTQERLLGHDNAADRAMWVAVRDAPALSRPLGGLELAETERGGGLHDARPRPAKAPGEDVTLDMYARRPPASAEARAAARRVVTIELETSNVVGELSPRTIQEGLRKQADGLKRCFRETVDSGDRVGHVLLMLKVAGASQVTWAQLRWGSTTLGPIGPCITRMASAWKFPATLDRMPASIVVEVVHSAKDL